MPGKYTKEDDFESLMREVDSILAEDSGKPGPESQWARPQNSPVQNYANGYGQGRTGASGAVAAYNPDFDGASPYISPHRNGDDLQPNRQSVSGAAPVREPAPSRMAEPARPARVTSAPRPEYVQEPEDEEEEPEEIPEKPKKSGKKKKKHHPIRNFFLLILVLLIGAGAWIAVTFKQPMTDKPLGERKPGAATILLCGTDADGTRTDTMMLLYLNTITGDMNLVSLPRDTLTRTTAGNYAKLNSAFGRNNGGSDPVEGMEALMEYVEKIVGFLPDGYMLVDLDCFIEAVDYMGGVDFDVPRDMYYEDPTQDLLIDLKEGMQHLNGYQAMGLVRFRKGYATQDLGRVEVQRDFINACLHQWLTPANAMKLPKLLSIVSDYSTTNLTMGNLLWIGASAWRCGFGSMETATLPGYPDMVGGASVYVLYRNDTAELVNEYCNPYEKTITVDDLDIAQ